MKLNVKKVIIVIFIIALIVIGVFVGISLTQSTDNTIENIQQETATKNSDLNINEDNSLNNTEIVNNTVENSNSIDETNNNITTNNTTTSSDSVKKEDLNSYLEKFSLICYLDSRTKDLEKEIKRNEDYIDIAMTIAKETNALGTSVEGKEAVSRQTIHNIISEIRGRTISDTLQTSNILYSYDNSTDQYYANHTDTRIAHIFEILENTTENGGVKVKYSCCFPNKTQLENNNFSGLGKYIITMELSENSNYTYSKYRIQNYEFVIE